MVYKFINRYLPEGSAIRHVSTLVSGAALGQLAVFLSLPILTRLYVPDEFGVLAVYASILGIIGPVAGLRYELAIPLARTDGSAANILVLALLCVLATTTLLAIFIALFGKQVPTWLNAPSIAPYLWLLPLGILLTGLYQTFNYWAIRRHSFSRIARTKFQQGVAGAAVQVGLGFANLGPLGLIIGLIVGQSAGLLELIRGAHQKDLQLMSRVRWQRIKQRGRRYQRFPKYSTWEGMANSASSLLPLILFAVLLSPEIAGLFLLAHKSISTPLALVGNAIGQVFFGAAPRAFQNGLLKIMVYKTILRLAMISFFPLLLVYLFGAEVFSLLFGDEWEKAGQYAEWMAPWLFVQFCISPVSTIVIVLEIQKASLVSQILFLIIRVGTIITATTFYNTDMTIFLYCLSGTLVYGLYMLWILRLAKGTPCN